MEPDTLVAGEVDVLLVMADRRQRAYALGELLELGYEVVAVPRARHARALVRAGVRPRLLVVDLAGLSDGGDAVRDLLTHPPLGLLVLVSAFQREDVAHLPPGHVLVRPFTVGQLVERVRHLLGA